MSEELCDGDNSPDVLAGLDVRLTPFPSNERS